MATPKKRRTVGTPKKSKTAAKTRRRKAGADAPIDGCLCDPGSYAYGTLFFSNGDDAYEPIPPGDEGDTLRWVGGAPVWAP